MKRWLSYLAAALSLLLLVAAVAAWASSYVRPGDWRLIGTAHSADLTRVESARRTLLFTTTPNWSNTPNHGFWDAWWSLSRRGRLTLLTQVIDYQGTLRQVRASPPSLIVDLPGGGRPPVTVFAGLSDVGRRSTGPGFQWRSDAQPLPEGSGPVSARAWLVTVPYWFIVLLGLPIPLIRLIRLFRLRDRRNPQAASQGSHWWANKRSTA